MPQQPRYTTPPSAEEIAALAERALVAIPAGLRQHLRGVAILVEQSPDDETLQGLGIDDPWALSGLYRGVPLGLKDAGGVPTAPDVIVLYREPILLEWIEGGEDLFRLVRNVVVHEVAHHFGFSDEDIEALERD